jgi:hypothetical protein
MYQLPRSALGTLFSHLRRYIMTNPTPSVLLNGRSTACSGQCNVELNEGTTAYRQDQDIYPLLETAEVEIQRRLTDAKNDFEPVASRDEIVIWSKTDNIRVSEVRCIRIEIAGQPYLIEPSSDQQELVLQFAGKQLPTGIDAHFSGSLRLDTEATQNKTLIDTQIPNLSIYGTPQFQFRVLAQLALLAGQPALRELLQSARKGDPQGERLILMQLYAGNNAVHGQGWDPRTGVEGATAITTILYDPYTHGEDAVTALFTVLYSALIDLSAGDPTREVAFPD